MACSKPLTIVNPHYKKMAEMMHHSVRVYGDRPDYRITVPCGHCTQCLKKRQQQWFLRAHYIYKKWNLKPHDCYFCTFTLKPSRYDEAVKEPYKPIRRFIDRLRKSTARQRPRFVGVPFTYFFVVEFADGETARKRGFPSSHRMHYHAVFFACPLYAKTLRELWERFEGRARVERLRDESGVRYVLKYVTKDSSAFQIHLEEQGIDTRKNGKLIVSHGFARLDQDDLEKFRRYMSHGSRSFFAMYIGNYPYSIPRYWKLKCFSKDELEMFHMKWIPPLLEKSIRRDHPSWTQRQIDALLIEFCRKWL